MEICEIKNDGLSRMMQVKVPATALAEKLDARISEMQPRVQLKGFRPGKAPISHIRRLYGRAMMAELLENAVEENTKKLVEDNGWRLAVQPEVHLESDVEAIVAGASDLAFHVHVEIMPDFDPIDIKSVSLVATRSQARDDELDRSLANLAEMSKTYEPKTGKSVEGDSLTVDFVGTLDGTAFDGGTASDAVIILGSGRYLADFETGLTGAEAGEERKFDVTFPADYGAQDLAGKTAQFTAQVKEVKKPVVPPVDEDLAKKLGFEKFSTLQDAARSQLQAELDGIARQVIKRRLLDALDNAHQFDVPSGLVEAEFKQIWTQFERERDAGRMDEEDSQKTPEELEADYRRIAVRRVRLGLVLAEYGTRAKVQVTDEEVGRAIAMEARKYPGQGQQIVDFYRKNPGALANVRAPIFEDKVVDYLLELINPAEEVVPSETLRELAEAE